MSTIIIEFFLMGLNLIIKEILLNFDKYLRFYFVFIIYLFILFINVNISLYVIDINRLLFSNRVGSNQINKFENWISHIFIILILFIYV